MSWRVARCSRFSRHVLVRRAYTTHSQLPEEHRMVYEMCRNFANEQLAPNAGEWDKKHEFPKEAVTKLVRQSVIGYLSTMHFLLQGLTRL